jgi:putative Holliday junction resolvase
LGRILALDYGKKRVGMAVTDPLQITANGLDTVDTREVRNFLVDYLKREEIDCVVVGQPKQLSNHPSESARYIDPFIKWFRETFPGIRLDRMDERFTSKMAERAIIDGGIKA